jgi:PGF-pre-PGF domain-containing protein
MAGKTSLTLVMLLIIMLLLVAEFTVSAMYSVMGTVSLVIPGVTPPQPPGPGPSGAGGGGGVGGAPEQNLTVVTIEPGQASIVGQYVSPGFYNLDTSNATDVPIYRVGLNLSKFQDGFRIIIRVVEKNQLEEGFYVPPLDNIVKYVNVTVEGMAPEEIGPIEFGVRVDKKFNLMESTVGFYRLTSQWDAVTIVRAGEDADYIYYTAYSPGLSIYAITGVQKSLIPAIMEIPSALIEAVHRLPVRTKTVMLALIPVIAVLMIIVIYYIAGLRKRLKAMLGRGRR